MGLNKTYVIDNKPLNNVLDGVQEFIDLIELFKKDHKHYDYDIKIFKKDKLFNGVIVVKNEE